MFVTQFITAACNRLRLVSNEKSLEQAYNTLDKDQDGKISLEDFKRSFGYDNESTKLEKIGIKTID